MLLFIEKNTCRNLITGVFLSIEIPLQENYIDPEEATQNVQPPSKPPRVVPTSQNSTPKTPRSFRETNGQKPMPPPLSRMPKKPHKTVGISCCLLEYIPYNHLVLFFEQKFEIS